MTTRNWRGIFNILQTPFNDTGDLLWRILNGRATFSCAPGRTAMSGR